MLNKIFLCVVLIIYVHSAFSQDRLLTPQQMKEDADYYFGMLYKMHPNLYYYYPMDVFENKKDSIYRCLNKPLTCEEFKWLMGEMNGFLDEHTMVKCFTANQIIAMRKDNNAMFFPNVKIENGKILLKKDNVEITEINGKKADEISRDLRKYFNWRLPNEALTIEMEDIFSIFLIEKYNMKAPYQVKFAGESSTRMLKGYSARELNSESTWGFRGGRYYAYEVYPYSSVAIFPVLNFESSGSVALLQELEHFLDLVEFFDIKNVFYDVTKNPGGIPIVMRDFCKKAFDIVEHGDVFLKVKSIVRKDGINQACDVEELFVKRNENARLPGDRKIYVLQGGYTGSAAKWFCHIVKQNRLGTLVGQPAAEPIVAFTSSPLYTMPHSKVQFTVATVLEDFSEYYGKDETLCPDVYWDVNNTRAFTEEELVKVVEVCRKEQSN